MNLYGLIGFLILAIVFASFFDLGPAIQKAIIRIADIPPLDDKGDNPAAYNFAVRLAYLIALVGIIKIIFSGRKRDD